jgi:hypothetical protein
MLIPWSEESVARAHALVKQTQKVLETDDADRLLEDLERDLDEVIQGWADGDGTATEMMDAYFIARAMLLFHRRVTFLQDLAANDGRGRRERVVRMIAAARSAGKVHQDWGMVEMEVTAAYWAYAGDDWS